ncbi:MAG: hypothetical protein RR956_04300, partial [Christensenella sp.]
AVDAQRAQYQKNGKYISDDRATGEIAAAQSGLNELRIYTVIARYFSRILLTLFRWWLIVEVQ